MMTPTAYRGLSAGAKDMNTDVGFSPIWSAVPVLPARLGDALQSGQHRVTGARRQVDMPGGDGRESLRRASGLVERVGGDAGLVDGAAIAERGVGVEQLERRDDGPTLAEGHLDVV